MDYRNIAPKEAYALQNAGGLVLVCTKGAEGRYDLAPVAWCCPFDYEPVSKLLCVLDTSHKTCKDIQASQEFVIALPSVAQEGLVMETGSLSGNDVDKYKELGIEAFAAKRVDAKIPASVLGWIECRLSNVILEGTSAIVMGEVLHAEAVENAWKERIHFVSDGVLFRPGATI